MKGYSFFGHSTSEQNNSPFTDVQNVSGLYILPK